MLIDYIIEGGRLMFVLAAIFFAVLVLAMYSALLLLAEVRRARRFRRHAFQRDEWRLDRLHDTAYHDPSLPARYLCSLISEFEIVGTDRALRQQRRQRADQVEESIVRDLVWPLEVLEFLGAYAAKVGLCGTILGLCMHFLAFGTEGSAQVASRAMAVALYTTLGALTIALVAEPAAYALGWIERRIRMDLKRWFKFLESVLLHEGTAPAPKEELPPASPASPGRDVDPVVENSKSPPQKNTPGVEP